ncbi:ABC transporter substrate-binding protein [Kalamiella sp. sgz302252]|uniref:ABC transporter substrate-binding protein n=1 Tax=Pantoea sp. sgz302252 TaxID=3341827 RepID=UPI0036D29135
MKKWLIMLLLVASSAAQAKTVTDILQRKVTVPDNPQRIVLGEGRLLYTLALVEKGNPLRRVAGWPADLEHYDRQTWARYTAAFPAIKNIPLIGGAAPGQLSVEKIIALRPDLVILPLYAKKPTTQDNLLTQLSAAGIPVIYVDTRVDQLKNTVPSLQILGEALDDQQQARRFIAFYQQHMGLIRERLRQADPKKPSVMLQLHIGRREECCTTVGHGNLADLLAFAGGNNIAAGKFSSVFGQLSPETVLAAQPDFFLATGLGNGQHQLQLGPQATQEAARHSFSRALAAQPVLAQLAAIRHGRTLAVWHNFYLSPWHLLTVEIFAKTLHPQLFQDVDPANTLREMNRDFLPLPETGTYWTTGEKL